MGNEITAEWIESQYRYHRPTPEAAARHERITEAAIVFAKVIRDNVPMSDGLLKALDAVAIGRMWANQGIACNHDALT